MISVIVCTYNREKYIQKCIESFIQQSLSTEQWELVIVNNKSTDNTDTIISDFIGLNPSLNTTYVIETSQGLSYARNRGLREAKGDFIIFIDDDAFVTKDYLKNVSLHLAKNPNAKKLGFGGKIKPFLECELPAWMSKYLSTLMSIIDLGDTEKLFPKNKYPIGANMGFSKSVVDEIGFFNEKLGRIGKSMLGGEEKDFFLRMQQANIPIYYFPKMLLYHVIPKERLTPSFIKKQARGIGISEYLRTKNINIVAYLKRWFMELIKWGGTLVLAFIYLMQFTPSKGIMLIKFRWWISQGLSGFSREL